MTEHKTDGGEQPDLATVSRDDLFLDSLGRGEEPTDGDDLAAMLASWRVDVLVDEATLDVTGLIDQLTADTDDLTADTVNDGTDPVHDAVRPAGPVRDVKRPGPVRDAGRPAGRARSAWSRRLGRPAVRLAAAASTVLVLATGLGLASRESGPTSPLWSLTKVLYPEQAEARGVEHTIERLRTAVAAGRFDTARELAEQAARELGRVTDPGTAARLRAELDAVLRDLAAATSTPSSSPPGLAPPAPAPTTTGRSADPSRAPDSGPTTPAPRPSGAPTPSPSATSQPGLLPSLPGLPLPSLPLPLPSLPGLPLSDGDALG
ncbi:Anti-sigma-D factor RsdA to sigma factor binding region [Micromonospora pallida]|uniref:Anti-sigma-D factor RsdA to sigma factor binding region n=1 Tax=Micromonospora pallida TaxID=145854 RepID=A0A1C6SDW1_9ACTN|nr:anti-sigma-D factor RsdA [Micromonospora pallida]SCL27686.1 Anti-sigma-D factor RsdA to sigma factor binding region [Micromonospora pallida]